MIFVIIPTISWGYRDGSVLQKGDGLKHNSIYGLGMPTIEDWWLRSFWAKNFVAHHRLQSIMVKLCIYKERGFTESLIPCQNIKYNMLSRAR